MNYSLFDIEEMTMEELSSILEYNDEPENEYKLNVALHLRDIGLLKESPLDSPVDEIVKYTEELLAMRHRDLRTMVGNDRKWQTDLPFETTSRLIWIYEYIASLATKRHFQYMIDSNYRKYISTFGIDDLIGMVRVLVDIKSFVGAAENIIASVVADKDYINLMIKVLNGEKLRTILMPHVYKIAIELGDSIIASKLLNDQRYDGYRFGVCLLYNPSFETVSTYMKKVKHAIKTGVNLAANVVNYGDRISPNGIMRMSVSSVLGYNSFYKMPQEDLERVIKILTDSRFNGIDGFQSFTCNELYDDLKYTQNETMRKHLVWTLSRVCGDDFVLNKLKSVASTVLPSSIRGRFNEEY